MVPTQGEVFSVVFYYLLLQPGIMSDQNTTMLAQPLHLSDIYQITHQQYNLHCEQLMICISGYLCVVSSSEQ